MEDRLKVRAAHRLELVRVWIAVGMHVSVCVSVRLKVYNPPNTTYPNNRCESGGEGVSAEGRTRVHGSHNLYSFKPHPFQIFVIETMIRQYLYTVTSTKSQQPDE